MQMTPTPIEIEVSTIMDRLRGEHAAIVAEVGRSGHSRTATEKGLAEFETVRVAVPRQRESEGDIEQKPRYHLDDFLRYHDEDFVRNAYSGILRRPPDPEGFSTYLAKLRTGALAKTDIVGRLRFSAEGRVAAMPVDGLTFAFALRTARRVPILGRLLGIGQYLLRLPDLVRNHERLEAVMAHQRLESHRGANAMATAIEDAFAQLNRRIAERVAALDAASIHRHRESIQRADRLVTATRAETERAQRLTSERMDAMDADLGRAYATLANAKHLDALAAEVGRLHGQAREDIHARIQALTAVVESKVDGSQLTMLTNGLVELMQRKVEHDELARAKRASEEGLRLLSESLERILRAKAEQVQLARLRDENDQRIRAILAGLEKLTTEKADQQALLEVMAGARAIAQSKADTSTVDSRFGELDRRLRSLGSQQRVWRTEVGARLDRVATPVAGPHERKEADASTPGAAFSLDRFYVDFEDRFRGSMDEIRDRVATYLPAVRAAGAGDEQAPVLDIGCGRGEWIALLRDSGLIARGVDINEITVRECRDAGLDVIEADALEYLFGLEDGSLGAVTGMHVVEHLPFERLLFLLDEVLRVLRPGGIAIFETPNPENVNV
ncbi:MAG: methyltransferase domain-containing protein, partial [Betaproteobacteria bacterium]